MKHATTTICTALLSAVCATGALAGAASTHTDSTVTTAPASMTPVRLDSDPRREIVRQLTVSFADLDLDRAEDRARLQERLEEAADRVCGSSAGSLDAFLTWKACYNDALDRAVAAVEARTDRQGQIAFTVPEVDSGV